MSPWAPSRPDAHPAKGQIEIIVDDDEITGGDRKEAEELSDSRAATVHESLRFDQEDLFPVRLPLADQGVMLFLFNRDVIFRGDPIHNQETQVVPGPRIFPAWVTQTENNLHR